jgi:hypothetical protein
MTTSNIPITNEQPVLIVWIEDGDELIHTDEHPFCDDPDCPCHEDSSLMDEYIYGPMGAGAMSNADAIRLYWAQHL